MARIYGLNVVSLWPYCLGPRGPERSIKLAASAGFDGIQALPMKGWSYKGVREWEDRVISFEDAFMYGPLWQAVLRQVGILDEPAPLLVDWLLFGRKVSPFFPRAILVAHHWQKGVAVEVNPELEVRAQAYLNFCTDGGRLCWDTLHVRREQRNGGEAVSDWRHLLSDLPAGSLELIHIHPTKEELAPFLAGTQTELTEMIASLGAKFPTVPAIVEVFPPLVSLSSTIFYLSKILTTSKRWLG